MYTARLDEPGSLDAGTVGGKAVGLATMEAAGMPVPPGFAVTTAAYRAYLASPGLRRAVDDALAETSPARPGSVGSAGRRIATALASAVVPGDVAAAITAEYAALCARAGVADLGVAVRSSATAEDSGDASFAGEFETRLDVVGAEAVVAQVRRCWNSVFSGRSIGYALERGLSPRDVEMAVVVQRTVRARVAGVMSTLSPVTGDRSRIVIEASWGLGPAVVGGEVTPDRYTVDKVGLTVCRRVPGDKRIEYHRGDAPEPVPEDRRRRLCLTDREAVTLAGLGRSLERLQQRPQDIEFAVDASLPEGADVVLLQCRPETVWADAPRPPAFPASAGVLAMVTASMSRAGAAPPGDSGRPGG
jgi:pyruvate,water dikinase